ncbi:hypothetical protein ACI3E1_07695 [Ligilactobacillus sp. LYQ139]|uniref:hypothetical protein n=1 Tax=Ligilactobacillus sp. LYQ139 TaxID=3378800 RepID=UPI003853589C
MEEHNSSAVHWWRLLLELIFLALWILCLISKSIENMIGWLGMQVILNLLYQDYLMRDYRKNDGSRMVWIYRVLFTVILLTFWCCIDCLYVNNSVYGIIGANFLTLSMLLSLIFWAINIIIIATDASEKGIKIASIFLIICSILACVAEVMKKLSGNVILAVLVIIFLMKLIKFSIDPKNLRSWNRLKKTKDIRKENYNLYKFRKQICNLIDFMIFPTTIFRFMCEYIHFGFFKWGYFPCISGKEFYFTNIFISILNDALNVALSIIIIMLIGSGVRLFMFIVNWLYKLIYSWLVD